MIKLISFAQSFWLIQVQVYTHPYINRAFIAPVSVVHFSGKRALKAMVVDPKDGPRRSLPPGIYDLVWPPSSFYQGRYVWPREYCISDDMLFLMLDHRKHHGFCLCPSQGSFALMTANCHVMISSRKKPMWLRAESFWHSLQGTPWGLLPIAM